MFSLYLQTSEIFSLVGREGQFDSAVESGFSVAAEVSLASPAGQHLCLYDAVRGGKLFGDFESLISAERNLALGRFNAIFLKKF